MSQGNEDKALEMLVDDVLEGRMKMTKADLLNMIGQMHERLKEQGNLIVQAHEEQDRLSKRLDRQVQLNNAMHDVSQAGTHLVARMIPFVPYVNLAALMIDLQHDRVVAERLFPENYEKVAG